MSEFEHRFLVSNAVRVERGSNRSTWKSARVFSWLSGLLLGGFGFALGVSPAP